jgi:hypothetical protein
VCVGGWEGGRRQWEAGGRPASEGVREGEERRGAGERGERGRYGGGGVLERRGE